MTEKVESTMMLSTFSLLNESLKISLGSTEFYE